MSGYREDFERLVALYERRIYNVALRLTSSPDEAADLTQETFLRAFRAWARFRKEAGEYTWLYRILINLNKDRIASESKRRAREVRVAREDDDEREYELADAAEGYSELRDLLVAAIESLPPGYRECIVLRDVEGLSYEEISEVMGITVEAVRSRLARARQQLRQKLAPYLKT